MSRNVIFLFLLTAVLALGLIGCAPTVETNAAQLPSAMDMAAVAVEAPAVDSAEAQAQEPLPAVDQAVLSSGYPGGENAAPMEGIMNETPTGSENPGGETPGSSGIVNQDPDSAGITNQDPESTDSGIQEPGGAGITNQDNSGDAGIVNTAGEAPGSAPGGPALGAPSETGETISSPGGEAQPGGWLLYTHQAYGFQIAYPQAYALRQPGVTADAGSPTPLALVEFIDPVLSQGDRASLQPPELAIRIYDNSGQLALDTWLRDAGKLNPDLGLAGERYDSRAGSGVQICLGQFVAPRCAIYFAHGGAVYELTPLGEAGENMVRTFAFS